MMLFVDSNIWAYYFDERAPEHKYVVKPVEEALRAEEIAINTVIIMEVAHFLIKNLGAEEGWRKLDVFPRHVFPGPRLISCRLSRAPAMPHGDG